MTFDEWWAANYQAFEIAHRYWAYQAATQAWEACERTHRACNTEVQPGSSSFEGGAAYERWCNEQPKE